MKRLARFLLFLLLILVLLAGFVFMLNNSSAVPLWVGTDLAPLPLGLWVLLAFTTGGLLGLLLGMGLWRRFRNRLEVRQLRARLARAESELGMLKQQQLAVPAHDSSSFPRMRESSVVQPAGHGQAGSR